MPRAFAFLSSLMLLFALMANLSAQDARRVKRTRGSFTIGKETTYFLGPFDKDGYIDYAAALNKKLGEGEGITPQNNAVVLLWKAHGPRPLRGQAMPAGFFRWLGMNPPPEKGDYFIDLGDFLQKAKPHVPGEDAYKLRDRLLERPWTRKEYPKAAQWLEANEKSLALVMAASKRSHYFSPLFQDRIRDIAVVRADQANGPAGLNSMRVPGVVQSRALGEALLARAMMRLSEGDSDAAWQDLLACHRLGRLIAGGATLIEGLTGIALDRMASDGEIVYLNHASPDAKLIKDCRIGLSKMAPMPSMADRLDLTNRCEFLDSVMMVDRYGMLAFYLVAGLKEGRLNIQPNADSLFEGIDWDPALREVNRWHDRVVAGMRLRSFAERIAQLRKLQLEAREYRVRYLQLDKLSGAFKAYAVLSVIHNCGAELGLKLGRPNPPRSAAFLGDSAATTLLPSVMLTARIGQFVMQQPTATERGEFVGDTLLGLMIPAVAKLQEAADRASQIQANLQYAFALAQYQRDHGRYPAMLDALVPRYLQRIPLDLFSGLSPFYRLTDEGVLLYSVGVNGVDDGGRSYNDNPSGDDLAIRLSNPQKR